MNPEQRLDFPRGIMRRRRAWMTGLVLVTLGMAGGWVRPLAAADRDLGSGMPLAATGTTVITSQRLDFDNRQKVAVFEGNVFVQDATMRMRSDRLKVVFDETEKPVRIEATGGVVLMQENRLARSQSAIYDVAEGKMVLTGSAEVRRNNDLLRGDTITFWRDQDRIEVVPGMLILSPGTRTP